MTLYLSRDNLRRTLNTPCRNVENDVCLRDAVNSVSFSFALTEIDRRYPRRCLRPKEIRRFEYRNIFIFLSRTYIRRARERERKRGHRLVRARRTRFAGHETHTRGALHPSSCCTAYKKDDIYVALRNDYSQSLYVYALMNNDRWDRNSTRNYDDYRNREERERGRERRGERKSGSKTLDPS